MMPPAEQAAIDQALAFIREQADEQEVSLLLDDKVFASGVSFGLAMFLRLAERERAYLPLPLIDLGDAWQDRVRRRLGA